MMLQGCRKADRAEVVERDRFATPNSLKSHGERNRLSPFSNPCAITPKLCMPSRPIHHPKITRHSNQRTAANLHSARSTTLPHFPAISCLGAFRTPAAAARDSLVMPASRKPAQIRTLDVYSAETSVPLRRLEVAGGARPRLIGLTMGWLLDRTLGSDPVHQGSSRP